MIQKEDVDVVRLREYFFGCYDKCMVSAYCLEGSPDWAVVLVGTGIAV